MAIANDAQHDGEVPAMAGDAVAGGAGEVRGAVEAGLAATTGGTVHPGLAAAVSVFEAAGTPWAILRGSLDGSESEVDLLVGAAAAGKLRSLLAPAGFFPLPAIGHGGHRFFRAYDAGTDRWFTLDVVVDLAFGPGRSLLLPVPPQAVLAGRLRGDGGSRLAPDDAFWLLLLHDLLDRAGIPDHHAEQLARLVAHARPDGQVGRAIDGLAGEGTARQLIALVASGNRSPTVAAGRRLGRRWARVDPAGTVRRRAGQWALSRLRKPFTALRRPGIGITILGPDGAGKSSLAEALRTGFPTPTRTIYLGLYGGGLAGGGPLGLVHRLGRLWRGWLVGRWHRWRGRLVVYDRHALDAHVPGRHAGTRSRIRRWILAHAIPAPELIVVLDAPAEVLFARKGEHDVTTLESQRRGYAEIARRFGGAQLVDAARDADLVRRDVTERTWRRLAKGYRGG
jgi:thymidylate kinase